MKRIFFAFFFFALLCQSHAQSEPANRFEITAKLRSFRSTLYNSDLVDTFINSRVPRLAYARNSRSARQKKLDTSRVNMLSIMHFKKHPSFDSTSCGGRVEFFSSVCADRSCVYEVSHKVIFSFETLNEAYQFVKRLLPLLRGPSIDEWHTKSDSAESFSYSYLREDTGKYNYSIFLKLNLVRSSYGFDLEIF